MNKIMLTDSEFEEVKISSRSVEVSKELTETEVQEQLLYSVTKGCLRDLLRILSAWLLRIIWIQKDWKQLLTLPETNRLPVFQ